MTVSEVAVLFGVSLARVRFLARQRGVGTKTPDGWRFTAEDVERMRPKATPGPVPLTQQPERNEL